ncbi:cytochrome P450 [Methyloceanibacter sp.]|uniref:cytochrome P450 n=1 Tax=Methyloceanibacter sp. TaxID=1965321 RepID=UPI002D4E4543|nr:cytochrome P450 [Methyloceanibacter sp.]HZP10751.1 cytochrome P450 [Methyloceanibacter sp.]
MTVAYSASHGLGEEQSIWYKLTPLLNQENPMQVLMALSDKYGGVVPINLKNHRIVLLSEPAHAERVLVTNADNYTKYFDGLRPVFGRSMITIDGALWQKIRAPQQPAFHPNMFEVYFPYLMSAIESKMGRWAKFASTGETIEMVEETWTLAAEMVCKALFDREMPFNPHFVFGQVKTYTDVMNHKSIRLKNVRGEIEEITAEDAAKAMEVWGSIPDTVIGANVLDYREKTLLKMLQAAEADPNFPEFDRQQVIDEMKQYLWAGTETTALTLAWSLYLLSMHPEALERIRAEARAVCGERDPEWNEVQHLTYTRMVIQETMRLFPPIWALIRIAAGDDEIGGRQIKAGDKVVILAYVMHHSPNFWEEPEKFEPERFAPERAKKRTKYTYLPFAAGKRSCIGGALSQIENTLALVQLLRRFTPEYVGPVPAKIHATVTLCPKGGLPFRIHPLS